MSDAITSTGTQYALVAGVPATYDEAGFTALDGSMVDVGEVSEMGEYGPQFEVVTHNPLATRRTVKRKGTVNDGALNLVMARAPTDAGQAAIIAGVDGADIDAIFSHRVTLPDGSKQYFTGQLFSYTTNIGGADQILGASTVVELDNQIVEVAAP